MSASAHTYAPFLPCALNLTPATSLDPTPAACVALNDYPSFCCVPDPLASPSDLHYYYSSSPIPGPAPYKTF